MKRDRLRIASRKSLLALWQANFVKQQLEQLYPDLHVEIITFVTEGDKILDTPLAKIGGKGLFVKELEKAMLAGEADLAVHSIKDMPAELPAGLMLATICERGDPRDVMLSDHYNDIAALPKGAVMGTSSLRRQCQLKALYPHLQFQSLRGNVQTRIAKMQQGEFDAIILAAAGVKRLSLAAHIKQTFQPEQLLPAVGQGAIGLECREQDGALRERLAALSHAPTHYCVTAERAMNQRLVGGCEVPIAAHARLTANGLTLHGLVGEPDGSVILRAEQRGVPEQAAQLGARLAEDLLAQGAARLLKNLRH